MTPDLKKNLHIAAIFIILAIIIGVIIYFTVIYKKELYGNYDNTICDKLPIEKENITSDTLLSSGVINKYIVDKEYHYIYQFNLPLSTGNDYNQTLGNYNVYLGNTAQDLQKVGELIRNGDGFYMLEYKSPIDYKLTQIEYALQSDSSKLITIYTKNI